MLFLQFININKPSIKISGATISIGQDLSNDLVIDKPGISDFHAEIIIEEDRIWLSDLLSETGTFVNNQRISRNKELQPWDHIKLASVEIELSEAEKYRPGDWALKKESDLLSRQYLPLKPLSYVGRSTDCDLVILDGLLSRKHALLTIEKGVVLVEDLKSVNGTFINGKRITTSHASPGDEITFDKITFELLGPSISSISAELDDSTALRNNLSEETIDISTDYKIQKTVIEPTKKTAEPTQKTQLNNKKTAHEKTSWVWGVIGFLLSMLTGLILYYFLR